MHGCHTSAKRLDLSRARRILDAAAPGHRLLSITPATAAFTNSVHVLDTVSPKGHGLRLVVKRMIDDPDPQRATADYYGLHIARSHGIPTPEPILLDATGEVLGTPGIVTTFVRGKQIANPESPIEWARDFADLLLRIHAASLDVDERQHIYNGNDLGLFFLAGQWPKRKAGHPLSDTIYGAIRELRPHIRKVPPVLLHMDYWPGNVLWLDGRVSAVLDWTLRLTAILPWMSVISG